jgi:hypothetical protein
VGLPGAPRRILFSHKPEWEAAIRGALPGDTVHFLPFEAPLDVAAYDLVLPLTLDAARFLNWQHAGQLAGRALVPSDDAIALADDKLRFARFLQAEGLGAHVPALDPPLPFPHVIKPRHGAWGHGIVRVDTEADAQRHATLLAADTHFAQACTLGREEFTTHLLVRDGRIAWGLTFGFVFETDRTIKGDGGEPRSQWTTDHGPHWPLFQRILIPMRFSGVCCFNYKLDGGRPMIFELNPRFGGSLSARVADLMPAYATACAAAR